MSTKHLDNLHPGRGWQTSLSDHHTSGGDARSLSASKAHRRKELGKRHSSIAIACAGAWKYNRGGQQPKEEMTVDFWQGELE